MPSGSMRSAIYYPHVSPHSTRILRTALLLWDELEFIVPWNGFRELQANKDVARALEVIGRFRVPSQQEKKLAHDRIEEFATGQLPAAFRYRESDSESRRHGFMFARKLLPETWSMLRELHLAGPEVGHQHDLEDAVGLSLMSILTDCCAGDTKARVTDRELAYAQLTDLLVQDARPAPDSRSTRDAFVPITLSLIDAKSVPLSSLVALREREAKANDRSLGQMRKRYRERIEREFAAASKLTRANDLEELHHQFELDMKDDLAQLREELRLAKGIALTSKDVIITAVVSLGTAAGTTALHWPETIAAATAAGPMIGGLVNERLKYAKERRSIIERHPMAYMLEVAN